MKLALALIMLIPLLCTAQTPAWKPDKTVELIIGAAPGGANDRIGRTLQRLLQDGRVNTAINVLNKPGGGQSVSGIR